MYMTATIICRCWLYYFHIIITPCDKTLNTTQNYATSTSTIITQKHAYSICNTAAQTNIITPFNILYATTFNTCNYKNILLKRKNRIFCTFTLHAQFHSKTIQVHPYTYEQRLYLYIHKTCKKRII